MPHICHATGCHKAIPGEMWGCKKHWFMVPKDIRDEIWMYYREGQESDWAPNEYYLRAAKSAVVVVAEKEGRVPDTALYDAFLKEFE